MGKVMEKAVEVAENEALKNVKHEAVQAAENVQIVDREAEQAALLKRRRRRIRALRSFLIRLVLLAAVVYVLFFHIVGLTTMPSTDMSPRLDAGDLLLYYRVNPEPKIQDVIVIRRSSTGKQYVSRVVAGPGDSVEVTEERGLAVNGNTLSEPYIFYPTRPYEGYVEYPVVLGDGEYFVMADSRNGGEDSRYFGPVKREEIQGIVITILRRNNL